MARAGLSSRPHGERAIRVSRYSRQAIRTNPTVNRVTYDAGFDELPELYARGLRLARSGQDDAGIATELGIEQAAVPSLLRLAEAKLARVRRGSQPDDPDPDPD